MGLLLLAALLGGCSGTGPDPMECRDCNVVLVTFDALRADRLGGFGHGRNTSPELDAFARRAFVFTRALSQSGSTAPSLPSLMTGKYPFVDGAFRPLRMTPGQVTLADVLRANGYHTAAVIGWRYAGSETGLDQGFDVFDEDHVPDEQARRTRERAVRVLESLEPPFFLWIHFRPPHYPYEADEDVFQAFYPSTDGAPTLRTDDRATVLAHFRGSETAAPFILDGERDVPLTPSMLEQLRALYDGGIRRADTAFGELLDHLERRGRLEDTLVVVASDHGEALGEHGLFDHNYLLYSCLHTPILVRLPGAPGGILDHPVRNVDVFPTVLEALGIEHQRPIRGRSLFDAERADEFQFAEYEDRRTIVYGKYKLMLRQTPDGLLPPRLYDVDADPGELHDLAASLPDVVRNLIELSNSLQSLDDRQAPLEVDSKTREALRSLGYVQ